MSNRWISFNAFFSCATVSFSPCSDFDDYVADQSETKTINTLVKKNLYARVWTSTRSIYKYKIEYQLRPSLEYGDCGIQKIFSNSDSSWHVWEEGWHLMTAVKRRFSASLSLFLQIKRALSTLLLICLPFYWSTTWCSFSAKHDAKNLKT